jgi:hypothetical protein
LLKKSLNPILRRCGDISKIHERERERGNKFYTTEELLEDMNLKKSDIKWNGKTRRAKEV